MLVTVLKKEIFSLRCDGSEFTPPPTFEDIDVALYAGLDYVVRSTSSRPKPKGFLPFTDYQASGERVTYNSPGEFEYIEPDQFCHNPLTIKSNRYRGECTITNVIMTDVGDTGFGEDDHLSLGSQALAEAMSPIFDVATNVGELPEVAAMLKQAKNRLGASVIGTAKEYKRRNRDVFKGGFNPLAAKKAFKRHALGVASLWLEYRYGWRPLYGSIQDLNDAVKRVRMGPSGLLTSTGKKSKVVRRNPIVDVRQKAPVGSRTHDLAVTGNHSTVKSACSTVQVSPFSSAFNSSFLTTAWELTPWSFVVDWIVDVQSYLQAVSDIGVPMKSSHCVSTLVSDIVGVTSVPWTGDNGFRITRPVTFQYEKFSYDRVVVGRPQPRLRINPRLDFTKGLDLSALIMQGFR